MSERLVVVHPDAEAVAAGAAARLLTLLLDHQSVSATTHIALTGGTVGIALLAHVAQSPLVAAVDWTGVHLWWGDERFLPEGDGDRNEVQAHKALLDSLTHLPSENVHTMPAARDGLSVEHAALEYTQELAQWAPEGSTVPPFDLILLGMGPDAHVASLFPNHPDALTAGMGAIPVHNSPKPPALRVSLTFETIASSDQVWIVAAGAEKAAAVSAGLSGSDPVNTPVSAARGRSRTLWLVDAAAAGEAQPA